jgi:hypothetical protein
MPWREFWKEYQVANQISGSGTCAGSYATNGFSLASLRAMPQQSNTQ